MKSINILNYQGQIKKEDRKKPISHRGDSLMFTSCIDLSDGINVTVSHDTEISAEAYAKDIAIFIGWWTIFIREDLGGFVGFGGIKFNVVGFKVVG